MLQYKGKTVCFTGHRQIRKKDSGLIPMLSAVIENFILQGYCYFAAGGARGVDTLAAQVVLTMKKKYPQIHLILVLPFVDLYKKEDGWSQEEIAQYQNLKQNASKVVHIQMLYSRGCYNKRNRYLVDFSNICICYQYKSRGGTAYTTGYAKKQGIKVINCIKTDT